jgi:hypothetical protein
METDSSDTPRTVTITAIKDDTGKRTVAENLSRITSGRPPVERILARLDRLPWSVTRNASVKSARKLVSLLQNLGASVEISPPLPPDAVPGTVEPPAVGSPITPPPAAKFENKVVTPEATVDRETFPQQGKVIRPEENERAGSGEFLLEPLSLGGILDRTFQICRAHFWKLLVIAGIPILLIGAIALVVALIVILAGLTWQALGGLPQWIIIAGAVLIIPSLIVILIGIFYLSQGAMIHAVSSIYLGRKVIVKDAYRFVMGRLGKFVLTSFLVALSAFAFTLIPVLIGVAAYFAFSLFTSGWWSAVTWPFLLLIPFYCITKLLLFDKVVIIENIAYLGALKRSWHLLRGKADQGWPKSYFMRLVVLLNLFILINLTIAMVFQAPGSILAAIASKHTIIVQILAQLLSTLGNLVGSVFGSVCLVIFYYDLRNRKEGFDLKMLATMDGSWSEKSSK